MAARRKTAPASDALVMELGGLTLRVDIDSFSIPESSLFLSVIERLTQDAAEATGVRAEPSNMIATAAATFVAARRQLPTLEFADWFDRFTTAEFRAAYRAAKAPSESDPEA